MTETKNARPTVGAVEQAAIGKAGSISKNHFTTPATDRQPGFIESLLHNGAENGLTISDLHRLTGSDTRIIRKQIETERRAGALIISDNRHGYFLTDDPGEAQRFARSMLHRSREIARTAMAVEKSSESLLLSDLAVQSRIEGV